MNLDLIEEFLKTYANNSKLIEGSRPGQILYHSCSGRAFLFNCKNDKITAKEEFSRFDTNHSKNYGKGVSLSRDKNLNFARGERGSSFLYYLDADKLSNNHKIVPYDYWYFSNKKDRSLQQRSESEERIVGDIDDLHKYILKIEYTGYGKPFVSDWAYCSTGYRTIDGEPDVFRDQIKCVMGYINRYKIPLENFSLKDLKDALRITRQTS